MKVFAFWQNPENTCQHLAKFSKRLANFAKFLTTLPKNPNNLTKTLRLENLAVFLPGGCFFPAFRIWIPEAVQRSALCRESFPTIIYYLLAKFGFDSTVPQSACRGGLGELFVSRTHLGFLSFRKPNDF